MVAKPPLIASICSECGGAVEFPLGALQVRCPTCEAGMAIDAGQRLLRLDCPRCRGNFYYLDGALCGRCPFCDASLLALTHDRLLRYLVRPVAPSPAEGAELLLLPFWHLSGLVYGFDLGKRVEIVDEPRDVYAEQGRGSGEGEIVMRSERRDSGPQRVFRGRVVAQSLPDAATLALGVVSLGVRGSVFPLEPFSADADTIGHTVPPALAPALAREKLECRALDLARGDLTHIELQRAELVAETLSLFYYPYWLLEGGERRIWDAVSGQPERITPPREAPPLGGSVSFDELRILELACSSCGGALVAGNNAKVLPCSGCGLHWEVSAQGLRPFTAHAARPLRPPDSPVRPPDTPGGALGPRKTVWLPFWRVEVSLRYEGREASRIADLRQVLGLHVPPGELPVADPGSPLCYYVPAYGALKAPRMDVAARDLTRRQPLLEAADRGPGELYTCFLGADDARRLGYATFLQLLPPVARRLQSLRLSTGAVSLWYLPFAQGDRELENLLTGQPYDRAIFRGVRH